MLDDALRRVVIGRDMRGAAVVLAGLRTALTADECVSILEMAEGARAEGLLLQGLSEEEIARIDYYAAAFGFAREQVVAQTDQGQITAQTHRPSGGAHDVSKTGWNLAAWQSGPGEMIRTAAVEIMRMYGSYAPDDVQYRMPMIRTRAQARVNARRTQTPIKLRSGFTEDDVEIVSQDIAYSYFFSFEEVRLKHRKHAGGMSDEMQRGVTMSADAVTVLPYDPKRDRVLLIEQFRAPMLMRGDPHPWAIETIAGRLDPGETPEATAHREAQEEAGITLDTLHEVGRYYSAPGSNSEYIYSYIGICDLRDSAAGIGGVSGEQEDIRAMVLPFSELEAALESGEVEASPLLISTLWLQRERERLRAAL